MSAHVQSHAIAPPAAYASAPPAPAAAAAPGPYAPVDDLEGHILRPNAFSMSEIVAAINGGSGRQNSGCDGLSDGCCLLVGCCGLLAALGGRCCFRTGVGQIDLWLDSSKRPLALEPNVWQCRPNFMQEKLGTYDMSSSQTFSAQGANIIKVETGSVYFANQGGQPVMIAGSDRPGWFCSTDAGFSFAQQIQVDSMTVYGCRAKLSSSYINFESLHLFSVVPNTVHIVSKNVPGVGNQWQVLPPGSHSFSSPFMRSTAVIPTSIQDVIIVEDRVSTQDGISLSNCKAVLSYQIKLENVHKLLDLDVKNYGDVIKDWAKRTMLHEIGNTDYQSHTPMASASQHQPLATSGSAEGEPQGPGGSRGATYAASSSPPVAASSSSSILGSKSAASSLPGAGGPRASPADESDTNFRPTLEHHMKMSLAASLRPYGVDILTFSLQSFDPPAALASQVTAALARRTEAQYQYQAAQIQNQTLLAAAETDARAIEMRAAAVAKAAALTASVPHACRLQILDKQIEIANAWSHGNATTLVLQQPIEGGAGAGAGAAAAPSIPFTTISELAANASASRASAPPADAAQQGQWQSRHMH